MSEFEKMLQGKIYDCTDEEIKPLRAKAHRLCFDYNKLYEDDPKREEILEELLGYKTNNVYFQGPIQFDYGFNFHVGKNFFCNFNFVCLDISPIYVGDNVFFGPNVSIVNPVHPLIAKERNMYQKEDGVLTDKEYSKPITIGSNCWLASNVTVAGGVTIGEGCVIGAGSVVVKDIPPHSLAAGNPCKVIRTITEKDSIYLKKELF